jgi:biotin carboxyl carrier protein
VAHISIEAGASSLKVELLPDGRVRVGDVTFTVEDLGGGAWRATSEAGAASLWAAGPRENPWVYYGGVVYRPSTGSSLDKLGMTLSSIEGSGRPELAEGRPRVGAAPATRQHRDDLAALSAPMPATVRAVLVTPGQVVVRGETVVILEAMKMELPLRAPHDGEVKAVRCQPGELVHPGTPLLEIQ